MNVKQNHIPCITFGGAYVQVLACIKI